jgi:hypothetical protein
MSGYNMDTLSQVRWGDPDGLNDFLFENGIQHQSFAERLQDVGFQVPRYPLIDADVEDLDDWLAIHQIEHQAFATILDLDNPFNLLDADWNQEDDFYDWIQQHLLIHEQIARTLGVGWWRSVSRRYCWHCRRNWVYNLRNRNRNSAWR